MEGWGQCREEVGRMLLESEVGEWSRDEREWVETHLLAPMCCKASLMVVLSSLRHPTPLPTPSYREPHAAALVATGEIGWEAGWMGCWLVGLLAGWVAG